MSPPGRSQGEFRSAQQGCLMLPRPGARQERHATGLRRQGRHADADRRRRAGQDRHRRRVGEFLILPTLLQNKAPLRRGFSWVHLKPRVTRSASGTSGW